MDSNRIEISTRPNLNPLKEYSDLMRSPIYSSINKIANLFSTRSNSVPNRRNYIDTLSKINSTNVQKLLIKKIKDGQYKSLERSKSTEQ